jgi:glutamate racemase
VVPAGVRFVDGGPGIARRIATLTAGQEWGDRPPAGTLVFTRLGESEQRLAARLRAHGFDRVESL